MKTLQSLETLKALKDLEEKYTGKWKIIKRMIPRVFITTIICIGHIHLAFWLVKERVAFPFLKSTNDLTKCTIEVSNEACLFKTTISVTFTYLQFVLPLVILLILLLVIYAIKISAKSKGYRKKGKEVMIDLLLQAYIFSGVAGFALIQLFFKWGINKGNTYDDLALKYTILYALLIPGTLLVVYINKKRSKKRKLRKLKALNSIAKKAIEE